MVDEVEGVEGPARMMLQERARRLSLSWMEIAGSSEERPPDGLTSLSVEAK